MKFSMLGLLLLSFAWSWSKPLDLGSDAKPFVNYNLKDELMGLKDFVGAKAKSKPKMVILSFWSTTCIPCRKEMPVLQKWQSEHANDVALLFVNVDKKDSSEAVKRFVAANNVQANVLLDFYQTTAKSYGVCEGAQCALPSLVVVDAQGKVKYSQTGYEDNHDLAKQLSELLTKLSTQGGATVAPSDLSKYQALHSILVGADHEAVAAKYGMTKEQLVEALKAVDALAKKNWGLQ